MPLVFFSGSLGSTSHRPRFIDICDARLLSCHGSYLPTAKKWLAEAHNHPQAKQRWIMLDSGAFTAWSKGESVSLKEVMRNYGAIIDRFGPYYHRIVVINLDVIPGSRGVTPTAAQIDEALIQSDRNFEELYRAFGDNVLPVFHQGESRSRLQEVARQNPAYICVSPRNDLNERQRVPWAQRVHAEIPKVPTHGLAATGVEMMLGVDWFSVDSATWVQVAGFGGIMIGTPWGLRVIRVSQESPARRFYGEHYDNVSPDIKRLVENECEKIDVTIPQLRTMPGPREWFNVNQLRAMSQRTAWDVKPQETLFDF